MWRPGGRREVLGQPHAHALGADLDGGRAVDGVGEALEADPAARVARERAAVEAEVEVLLHARRVQHRDAAVDQRVLALVRDRRRLGARVVAGQHEHAALRRRAGVVAVLQARRRSGRRRGPCRTRSRTRRRTSGPASRFACCEPQTAVAARSSFTPGSKRTWCARGALARLPEREVVGAERRAAVAGDEARRGEAGREVARGAARAGAAPAPARPSGRRARARACSGPRAGSSWSMAAPPMLSALGLEIETRFSSRESSARGPRAPRGGPGILPSLVDWPAVMKIGVTIHATDLAMSPVELAREAEARGFHSLYVPEHTHIPDEPPHAGADRRRRARARSTCAASIPTSRSPPRRRSPRASGSAPASRLVAQHDPITLAKEIATARPALRRTLRARDRLRLEPRGDGEPRHRREATARARARDDAGDAGALGERGGRRSTGEFVRFEPSWQWPKPVQQPRPPVLIGGAAGTDPLRPRRRVRRRLAPDRRRRPRAGACPSCAAPVEARGRDPGALQIVPMGVFPDAGKLDHYRSLGVTRGRAAPPVRAPRRGAARPRQLRTLPVTL